MPDKISRTYTRAILGNVNMKDNYNLVQLVGMLEERYARHPVRPDADPDYETLQGWWHLTAAYPIVEMELKLLTGCQEKTHDIGRLYKEFEAQHPLQAGQVEKAVWEYVVFYNVDLDQYPEFRSAGAFLKAVGDGKQYVKWRYWPIEQGDLRLTWPGLLIVIASALRSVLLDKEPYTVGKKIRFHIDRAITEPSRWVQTLESYGGDGGDLIRELNDWVWKGGGLRSAFEAYLVGGLDAQWSQALQCVLDGARQELAASEDPDMRHFMAVSQKAGTTSINSHNRRRVNPQPAQEMPRLLEIEAREPYQVWVRFDDGTAGKVDMRRDGHTIPSAWETPEKWRDVEIRDNAAVWDGWYDACPYGMWLQLADNC